MNKTFKTVFNALRGTMVAVRETAPAAAQKAGGGCGGLCAAVKPTLLAAAVMLSSPASAALSDDWTYNATLTQSLRISGTTTNWSAQTIKVDATGTLVNPEFPT